MGETISQQMLLDTGIRDWVLFPIMVVMLLVGIFRHHATVLLASTSKTSLKALRERQALQRVSALCQNFESLPMASFTARKAQWIKHIDSEEFLKDKGKSGIQANPMMDPSSMDAMLEGMKGNMTMIIPQTLIMSWVTFFFSGFVLIRIPFPLPLKFKAMLQRDINTVNMDVSWVSSLSWYFLNLFGLRSVFTFILGQENSAGGLQDLQQMQNPMAQAPGAQLQNFGALFTSQKEDLEILQHSNSDASIEEWLLPKVVV